MADVTVSIGGDASGAQHAARAAITALDQLANALRQQANQANYVAQASQAMGSAAANANLQWLRGAENSQEYAARLGVLRAQLAQVEATQRGVGQASYSAHQGLSALSNLLGGVGGAAGGSGLPGGGFAGGLLSTGGGLIGQVAQFAQQGAGAATILSGLFTDGVTTAVGAVVSFAGQAAAMLTAMVGFNIFQDAAGYVRNFANEVWNLTNATQRNEFIWQYQFGGGPGGRQMASQVAGWIPNFAMDVPTTWQDVMTSVTASSQMGLSLQGMQRFFPLIADLAATHTNVYSPGGGPLTMTQVAFALMEAQRTGLTRRMQYELQIHPRDLIPYGVHLANDETGQVTNPEMFLPALEAYAKDKGWIGAAHQAAHNTWYGLWSSFTDRMNKFAVETGGIYTEGMHDTGYSREYARKLQSDAEAARDAGDQGKFSALMAQLTLYDQQHWVYDTPEHAQQAAKLLTAMQTNDNATTEAAFFDFADKYRKGKAGDIKEGGPMAILQKGLDNFSAWLDAHWDRVGKFADAIGKLVGGGASMGRSLFEGLFAGMEQSGVAKDVLKDLRDAASWLADPAHQAKLREIGDVIGTGIGGALKEALKVGKEFLQTADEITKKLSPEEWKAIGVGIVAAAMTLEFFVIEAIRLSKILADMVRIAIDISYGKFDRLPADLRQLGADEAANDPAALMGQIAADWKKILGGGGSSPSDTAKQTPGSVHNKAGSGPGGGEPDTGGAGGAHTAGRQSAGFGGGPRTLYGDTHNQFNFYGATEMGVRAAIETATRKRERELAEAWRVAGGFAFGTIAGW